MKQIVNDPRYRSVFTTNIYETIAYVITKHVNKILIMAIKQ